MLRSEYWELAFKQLRKVRVVVVSWSLVTRVIFCSPGLANKLMQGLEELSDSKNCYFVDLFVRVSNTIAISFYKKLGYTVNRTVLQY